MDVPTAILIAGHIDLAVHSLKDLETWLPDGLAITCVLPRDDPRDAFLSTKAAASLAALPKGARVGTASLRRQAQFIFQLSTGKLLSKLQRSAPSNSIQGST
jgi:hydroxymethylbilane synthase